MGTVVYHALWFVAEKSGMIDDILDMTSPNIAGCSWRMHWSPKEKSGPESPIYHALDLLCEKSETAEGVLNLMSPNLGSYSWRDYWKTEEVYA